MSKERSQDFKLSILTFSRNSQMAFLNGDPEGMAYVPTRATDRQMAVIESAIRNSQDATDQAKKMWIWLLRQTRNLTRPVCCNLDVRNYGSAILSEVAAAGNLLPSTQGTTRIDKVGASIGTQMTMSITIRREQVTIWWSHIICDRNATALSCPNFRTSRDRD